MTPSYAPDLARCRLLVESLRRFARFDYCHYIIVSRMDRDLFASLAGPRTRVISTDEVFPAHLEPVSAHPGYWRTKLGRSVRGWIVQQLAKIAFADRARESFVLFVDSDIAFIRPFDRSCFVRENKARLPRVPNVYIELFEPWYEHADALLGVSGYVRGTAQPNYVAPLVAWESSIASRMCRRIEAVAGESWFDRLLRLETFSEYTIYGVYVDKCLRESSVYFTDERDLCHCHWECRDMNDDELEGFLDRVQKEHVAVMLTARGEIDPDRYRHVMDRFEVVQ